MKIIKFTLAFIGCFILVGCANTTKIEEGMTQNQPDLGNEVTEKEVVSYEIQEVVGGLEIPWDMAFTSENRMLITERPGRLRVFENSILRAEPLHTFSVSSKGEEGLMSIALDPDYQENKWIYLSWAYPKANGMAVKVSRFTDAQDRLEDEKVIIDDLPAARYHAGCRLGFGPDGKLYITVGDAFDKKLAQDLDSLAGKILRLNKDGSIPEDNPFPNSPIWSYGHRNPQGLDWNLETQIMYSTEHGPSLIDGPRGGDEVNLIQKGGNYGWPEISHDETAEGMYSPMIQFTPAQPPGSLLVYSGEALPQLKGHLFFGSLGGESLIHLKLDESGEKVESWERLEEVNFGRIRNVMEGPEGWIYFSTSNRDGRGDSAQDDDRIFVIKPLEKN